MRAYEKIIPRKNLVRVLLIVGLMLLIPLYGEFFIKGWNWDAGGFVFAFVLLFLTGVAIDAAARKIGNRALLALAIAAIIAAPAWLWLSIGSSLDDVIVLTQNMAVPQEGGRLWRGTYWNHTDRTYSNVDVVILFLDKDGRPVGQVNGGASTLDPGEVFHLEAKLPPEAVNMRMYQLRWGASGEQKVVLGPFQPWAFGYVQAECSEADAKSGACAMKEST
jgi:hypothetical protein